MIRRLFLLLLCSVLLASCSGAKSPLHIEFAPVFGGQVLTCGDTAGAVQLTDLRFYVSEIELVTTSDDVVNLQLEQDGIWQQADLAFLDMEDGQGFCDNGTSDINATLRGLAPDRDYIGIRFVIGVPFDRNHADPLTANAPLGEGAMHWHWRAGYKFLRAGIQTADDGFWLHLGSTGCKGTVQDITGCNAPNRVYVELMDFIPGEDVVEVDLTALVANTDLEDGIATDCSSGPAESDCAASFASLGLSHATGTSGHSQRVFRKQVQD
jgi:uncharacterized repeat protein (TIGR04052 family)